MLIDSMGRESDIRNTDSRGFNQYASVLIRENPCAIEQATFYAGANYDTKRDTDKSFKARYPT